MNSLSNYHHRRLVDWNYHVYLVQYNHGQNGLVLSIGNKYFHRHHHHRRLQKKRRHYFYRNKNFFISYHDRHGNHHRHHHHLHCCNYLHVVRNNRDLYDLNKRIKENLIWIQNIYTRFIAIIANTLTTIRCTITSQMTRLIATITNI